MPESFFVLSKENLELAKDEIIAIAKTYDRFAKAQSFSNLIVIQSRTIWEKIAERATFVKTSGQILKKNIKLIFIFFRFCNKCNFTFPIWESY